jgi:hypothetical protein
MRPAPQRTVERGFGVVDECLGHVVGPSDLEVCALTVLRLELRGQIPDAVPESADDVFAPGAVGSVRTTNLNTAPTA